ncbi:hypothetical protein LX36DRAFT_165818 [Colletotrichum falcatum]|nr:hypothetical protein LX36DRAFT_165818 [Colletotrichum falcatum]
MKFILSLCISMSFYEVESLAVIKVKEQWCLSHLLEPHRCKCHMQDTQGAAVTNTHRYIIIQLRIRIFEMVFKLNRRYNGMSKAYVSAVARLHAWLDRI